MRDQRESALLGAEVGEAQRGIGVEHHAKAHIREVMALGDHLRSDQQATIGGLEATQDRTDAVVLADRIGVEAEHREAAVIEDVREIVLQALGAGAVARDGGG